MTEVFKPIETDEEFAAAQQLLGSAFGVGDPKLTNKWIERAGRDQTRLLYQDEVLTAALLRVPQGQFFLSGELSGLGIAGVGVPPEHRGKGSGKKLMHACMKEAREEGTLVSTLYPATRTVYRGANYEMAGYHQKILLDPMNIPTRFEGAKLPIHRATADDYPRLQELQVETIRHQHGDIRRGDYVWQRIWDPKYGAGDPEVFYFGPKDAPEGYVVLLHGRDPSTFKYPVVAVDLVTSTVQCAKTILSLFASMRSIVKSIGWTTGPSDMLLDLLPEKAYKLGEEEPWMLRILNVEGALKARGYPLGVKAELKLEIEDDQLADNSGTYLLKVAEGKAAVEKVSGPGDVKAHVRPFAPLFTGYRSPRLLARNGLIEGEEKTLQLLESVFSGPAPSMNHLF